MADSSDVVGSAALPYELRRWAAEKLPGSPEGALLVIAAGRLERLTGLIRDVVTDYAETCCDHPIDCDCSMARAYRLVNGLEFR